MKKVKRTLAAVLVMALVTVNLTGCDITWMFESDDEPEISREKRDCRYFELMHDEGVNALVPYTTQNKLCVTAGNVPYIGLMTDHECSAAGLFDVNDTEVIFASNIFKRLYPASTTKLMTAHLVLQNASLDEEVIVSDSILNLEAGSQVCGLEPGDHVTIKDLLYGLMLHSGNDAAVACAEYVGGSLEGFVDMMNAEATRLLMSGTHYCNPHGLHEEDHYTTAYDLYIIMNECIKDPTFCEILDTPAYTGYITHDDGNTEMITWLATNYYFQGLVESPDNVTIMGGKTGTTDEAGACLVLLTRDAHGDPYISIILDAVDKDTLYSKMTQIISVIPEA